MENKTLISVCIPVYGVEKYIERCARSLFEQSLKQGIEFIFVNDCTQDASIEILKQVAAEYPERQSQIKILNNKKNIGLARTRFVALAAAEGEYIFHCDSDDWVELEMLRKMLSTAICHNADIVCCNAVLERKNSRILLEYPYAEETKKNGLQCLKHTSEIFTAIWNKIIRRSLYLDNNVSYYDGLNMGEDSALTYRLRYFSKKTVIVPEVFYHYNKTNQTSMCASGLSRSADQYIMLARKLEEFFKKQNDYKDYLMLINSIKFNSKRQILQSEKDFCRWKSVFPETHSHIFRYSSLSLIGRVKWFVAACLPYWVGKKIFHKR